VEFRSRAQCRSRYDLLIFRQLAQAFDESLASRLQGLFGTAYAAAAEAAPLTAGMRAQAVDRCLSIQ